MNAVAAALAVAGLTSMLAARPGMRRAGPDAAVTPRGGVVTVPVRALLEAADTSEIDVETYTLVAFTAPLGAASAEAKAALAEYETGVTAVREQLEPAGVLVLRREATAFVLRDGTAREQFRAEADSAKVGYLLAAPGRRPAVRYGLRTADELLEWISTWIHHPDDTPRRRS